MVRCKVAALLLGQDLTLDVTLLYPAAGKIAFTAGVNAFTAGTLRRCQKLMLVFAQSVTTVDVMAGLRKSLGTVGAVNPSDALTARTCEAAATPVA